MERLITILGPTAVGKTDLTLRLAKTLTSPVISGDAYQIYRGLSIGTAKPSPEELSSVPHYLIDILHPDEPYSVAVFQTQAAEIISRFQASGNIPILSGGTGLYVQALLEGYSFSKAEPDEKLRQRLDDIIAAKGEDGLYRYAEALAKEGHITLRFTDKHRLYRAIELMERGDYDALTHQQKAGLVYDGPVIGLMRPRDELYQRINLRVDMMVSDGLFEEVEALLNEGVSPYSQAFKGIGYKEVVAYFNGAMTKAEAVAAIKQNTRRFAKRQITWYKRMPYIRWINIDAHMSSGDIYSKATAIIDEHYKARR